MCGIVLTRNGLEIHPMLEKIAHRGRDDREVWKQSKWYIGQNRLAIVDLGPKGHQPYVSSHGATVFNGEIFNVDEIYDALESKPIIGSEVGVIDALISSNSQFDRVLDGYYGIIFVSQHGWVTLSRDLIGVVPLYYQMEKNRLVRAASEKKAFDGKWREVRAGQTLIFDNEGRLRSKRQFDPYSLHLESLDDEHLEFLFYRAVARRVHHSEVPVTLALSGGLDSSLILVALSHLGYQKKVTAITVCMDQNTDEVQNAKALAERYNVEHLIVQIDQGQIEAAKQHILYSLEDPIPNPIKWRGMLRNYFVAKYAPGTVILCGEGADEIAAGYPSHRRAWDKSILALEWKVLSTVRSMPAISLDRVNKGGMAWTKEFRAPFVDRALVLYLMGCQKEVGKGVLRRLARTMRLPGYILDKPKYGIEEKNLEATL